MKNKLNLYIFAGVLMIAGAIFGGLLAGALTFDQQEAIEQDIMQYVNVMHTGPDEAGSISVWSSLSTHIKWLLLLWLFGVTVIGLPGALILIFIKGGMVGFAIGTFISQFGWKGVMFSAAALLPQNLFIIPAMIIIAAGAMSYAIQFVQLRILRQQMRQSPKLLEFTTVSVAMLAVFLVASLVETYVSPHVISWASSMVMASI